MLYKKILQFFYPTQCTSCNTLVPENITLCPACTCLIKQVPSIFLPITKKRSLPVIAACAYEQPVKSLILQKFSRNLRACQQLATLMSKLIDIQKHAPDYLVPIPLHWTRYASRGYNQATEIARTLKKQIKTPVTPSVSQMLARKKRTSFQSKLTHAQRQKNVASVFVLRTKYAQKITNKNIMLIDDLCTTGATLQSAAKILLPYKPKSITALVACRAL